MLNEILEAVRKGYDVKFRQVPVHPKLHDYNLRIEVTDGYHHEARDISPITIGDSRRQFEDTVCWTLSELIDKIDVYQMIKEVLQ